MGSPVGTPKLLSFLRFTMSAFHREIHACAKHAELIRELVKGQVEHLTTSSGQWLTGDQLVDAMEMVLAADTRYGDALSPSISVVEETRL